jgi:Alpha/beta hydrolase domain
MSLLIAGTLYLGATIAQAHVTKITVNTVESPTYADQSFGAVGSYTRINGTFTGKLDPADPHNAVIVDIDKAPRDSRGLVTYTADFQILKPTNLAHGNHRVLLELPNRGGALVLGTLNDSATGNTAVTAGNAGNGFLMNEGYTIVEVGWDLTAPQGGPLFGITLPVAANQDAAPITGPATEELVVDFTSTPSSLPLTYPTASLDATKASLTVRENYSDTPITIPSAALPGLDWQYIDNQHVELTLNGAPVKFGAPGTYSPTALYEFTYVAQNPQVVGIGFASVRDFATFLRDAKADDDGTANPLAGDVRKIYSFCLSQPCRTTRDFVYLGFNEADIPDASRPHRGWGDPSWWDHFWQHRPEHHERVFDGMLNWLGGGDGIFMNYRFAQPTRTHRQHIARWTPEFQFPFADASVYDPATGKSAGRLDACEQSNTCPRIFEVNSANEFWAKAGSMLVTDGHGHDLDLNRTPQVRYYLLSSLPHSAGSVSISLDAATSPGICRQPSNPMVGNVVLRALLVDLDQWVSRDTPPPPSAVPRIADGTLAPALPQSALGFPAIPGIEYNGIHHTGDLWSFGPRFDEGILSILPPVLLGTPYQVFLPQTDADGNDIAGVRVPDVSVPLATYTGWGLRAAHAGQPVPIVDGCDATGQRIPFAPTAASRQPNGPNAGDPRLSIAERYADSADYVAKVTAAANALRAKRLMLQADVDAYVTAAKTVAIP